MAADERDPRYEGWRVAGASAAGVFVSFASLFVYTFGIFLKPWTEEFGWSRESVSTAFGIAAMTVAVCSPPLGHLLDRVSPARVVVPCLVVFGLAFASLSLLTPNIWHLYAVFFVLGVVGNGTAQMAYSRAVSSWFEARRGMALAIVMAGGAVGAMVLPPVAESLIARYGWRQACVMLGAMVLVIGPPAAARFLRQRPHDHRAASAIVAGASVREGLRSRVFWILVAVLFGSSIAQNGAITHIAALLSDRGVTAQGAALAVSAMGAASLAGRLGTGWLLDRFFAAHVSIALLLTAALGTLLLATADSMAVGVFAAALIGAGMGGEADVTPYLLSRYFGLRAFSALYGLTWTAYAIAGAVGPILMGRAFDVTDSYTTLLTVLAGVIVAVAALNVFLPRYGAQPQDAAVTGPASPRLTRDRAAAEIETT